MIGRLALVAAAIVIASCASCGGAAGPSPVDTRNDTCSFCRMNVSDPRLAAQIVGAGEEPRFFDDIGCLAGFLASHPLSARQTAYVADHRTGDWVNATRAVYSRLPRPTTPMGSGLMAHVSPDSRAQDEAARGSVLVTAAAALAEPQGRAAR